MKLTHLLTRKDPTHNHLSTYTMTCRVVLEPHVGYSCILIGEPLGGVGQRVVITSEVVLVVGSQFHTKNSIYTLEELEECDGL